MRTETIKIYTFEELSEKSQRRVLDDFSVHNLDYEWWDYVYEDASQVGFTIVGFDLYRGDYVEGRFNGSGLETAREILENHGEHCGTWKVAKNYINLLENATDDYISEVEDDFLLDLQRQYKILLQNEYDWLTSDEAMTESIVTNEYEFTEDGKRWF